MVSVQRIKISFGTWCRYDASAATRGGLFEDGKDAVVEGPYEEEGLDGGRRERRGSGEVANVSEQGEELPLGL